MLRNKNTGTNEFRKLIEEIAVLMGYETLRDLPLEDVVHVSPDLCKGRYDRSLQTEPAL